MPSVGRVLLISLSAHAACGVDSEVCDAPAAGCQMSLLQTSIESNELEVIPKSPVSTPWSQEPKAERLEDEAEWEKEGEAKELASTSQGGRFIPRLNMTKVNKLKKRLDYPGAFLFGDEPEDPVAAVREGSRGELSDTGAWIFCGAIMIAVVLSYLWLFYTMWTHFNDHEDKGDFMVDGKERFPILDNLKLVVLCFVFMAHGGLHILSTPNALMFETPDSEFPMLLQAKPEPKPEGLEEGFMGVGIASDFIMGSFTLASGAVSGSEPNQARMAVLFLGILFPCVLLWAYEPILFGTIITDPQGAAYHWSLGDFGRMMYDVEPWYLKALVFWRIFLYVFGGFPDVVLVILSMIADFSYEAAYGSDLGEDVLCNYFRYLPFFCMGHVLFRRRKILGSFCAIQQKYWYFQPLSFIWFWVQCYDAVDWHRWLPAIALFAESYGSIPARLIILTIWPPLAFTGWFWMPTREVPVLTRAGGRTLTGYLLNGIAFKCALRPFFQISWLLPPSYLPLWLTCCCAMLPVLCVFCCSETLSFMFWWIFEPTWLIVMHKSPSKLSWSDICKVPSAVSIGWQKWLMIFAAFQAFWLLSGAYILL